MEGEKGYKKGLWTVEEDRILMDYITLHGKGRWNRVAKITGLKRCGKSCRLRWLNYLSPSVKHGNFSEEEDDLIIRLHNLLGNRWSLIAGRVPGRTDNQVKNHWNTHLSKKLGIRKGRSKTGNSSPTKISTKVSENVNVAIDANSKPNYDCNVEAEDQKAIQDGSQSNVGLFEVEEPMLNEGWRLLQRPQSLVARVFKARYFPQTSFLNAVVGSNPSFTWRSIVGSRSLLNAGLRWRVGNGASISVKNDKWVPRPHSFKVILPPSTLSDDARVCDLIDSEKGAWHDEMLTQNFLGMDVEAIRCIPLCPTLPSDKLVWHFTRNGEFSVRSAYHLCKDMASMDGHGDTSTSGQSQRKFWRDLWQLNLPTKLKIFGWKMCLGLLAVRANLRQRRIINMDLCPGCGVEIETVCHCFHNCDFAMQVWRSSSLNLIINPNPVNNCFEWICQLMASNGPEPMQLFITICWCIWNNRNSILFGNKSRKVEEVVSFAVNYVSEYVQAQERGHIPSTQVRMRRWVAPREGVFKLNFDGSVRTAHASAGVGIIIRDCHGEVIASMVERIQYMEDVDCVEATGAIKALQLGCDLGLGHIHLEGDSQNVVAAIQGKADNLSCYGHFVAVAQALLLRFLSSEVSHVCRDGNSVAHCLSRLAFDFESPRIWMEEVPSSLLALVMSEAPSSM
ncbi:unnamed protein product [Camellia sinensis]